MGAIPGDAKPGAESARSRASCRERTNSSICLKSSRRKGYAKDYDNNGMEKVTMMRFAKTTVGMRTFAEHSRLTAIHSKSARSESADWSIPFEPRLLCDLLSSSDALIEVALSFLAMSIY